MHIQQESTETHLKIIDILELADNESNAAVVDTVKGFKGKIVLRSEEMSNLRGEIYSIKNKTNGNSKTEKYLKF